MLRSAFSLVQGSAAYETNNPVPARGWAIQRANARCVAAITCSDRSIECPKKIGSNGHGVQLAFTTCTAYMPAQLGANAAANGEGTENSQPP